MNGSRRKCPTGFGRSICRLDAFAVSVSQQVLSIERSLQPTTFTTGFTSTFRGLHRDWLLTSIKMLPKVATHILHHTSRAVAAVQNQTGYTIRNVLQLQTQSSTPATTGSGLGGYGSSSWGSAGAGPGGAKYHAGSRFYSGYSVSPASMLDTLIPYPA